MAIGLQGGLLVFSRISDATTNITLVKAGPTQVGFISCGNVNAAVRYLKLFDKGVAVTLGSGNDLPVQTYIIPGGTAGAAANISISQSSPNMGGLQFYNGLCMALTTDNALTAASGVSLGDCVVNIGYL